MGPLEIRPLELGALELGLLEIELLDLKPYRSETILKVCSLKVGQLAVWVH